jgi:IS4 transposase
LVVKGRGGPHDRAESGGEKPEMLPDGGVQTADDSNAFELFECELDWTYDVHLETGRVEVQLQKQVKATDAPDIDYLAGAMRFDGEIPDSRATWHHNYTPIEQWFRAHILREARGFSIQELAKYLDETPSVAMWMGFFGEKVSNNPEHADPPGYTQLRDMWEEEFSSRTRGAVQVIAERLVEFARDQGFPAPDKVFLPEDDVEPEEIDEDDPTIRELTIEKTGDVWQHIRPMVLDHWHLKRHHNWQIPEYQFFDAHAALAADSDDVYPESGLGNMLAKGAVDDIHYPSTHRKELSRLSVEEIREMHHEVVKDLIAEARREGELVGKMTVAIDQTKGHPWTGEIERDEDGSNVEDWRLGYKNDNDTRAQYYYQWASVQVVGFDIPLVLDAIPVKRGMTKGEIVNELLSNATELLDDIELVLMDGGFDSEASKNSAEARKSLYMNRKSRNADDKERMREMWSDDDGELEPVRIVEQEERIGMPNRKIIYVPKLITKDDEDEEEEDDSYRQEMLKDFQDTMTADEEAEDGSRDSPIDNLIDEMREEEAELKDEKDEDDEFDPTEMFVAFETNHPLAAKRRGRGEADYTKREQQQAAARMVRKYGSRWGIENGFKKRGHFLPRSGSPDHTMRFFGFIFAATLYNAWRLVDILVKLSVEDDPAYTPLVTASRFMAVLEGQFGLSKPPPVTA